MIKNAIIVFDEFSMFGDNFILIKIDLQYSIELTFHVSDDIVEFSTCDGICDI